MFQDDQSSCATQPPPLHESAAVGPWRQSEILVADTESILRAALGAFLAVGAVGVLVLVCSFPLPDLMFVPSFGATATLLFANPGSLHAQPWPAIAGNTTAAATGIIIAAVVPVPVLDMALSVCIGLILICALRAFHPPAGAVAVTAVMGSGAGVLHGFQYVVLPVGVGMALIVVIRILYARVMSENYPIAARKDAS